MKTTELEISDAVKRVPTFDTRAGFVSSAPFPTATSLADPARVIPSLRMVCMDCGAELPGSNPQGTKVSHGLCRADFDRRMAELRGAA